MLNEHVKTKRLILLRLLEQYYRIISHLSRTIFQHLASKFQIKPQVRLKLEYAA